MFALPLFLPLSHIFTKWSLNYILKIYLTNISTFNKSKVFCLDMRFLLFCVQHVSKYWVTNATFKKQFKALTLIISFAKLRHKPIFVNLVYLCTFLHYIWDRCLFVWMCWNPFKMWGPFSSWAILSQKPIWVDVHVCHFVNFEAMEQNLLKVNYFNLLNFKSSNGFFTMGFFEKLYCKISLNFKI